MYPRLQVQQFIEQERRRQSMPPTIQQQQHALRQHQQQQAQEQQQQVQQQQHAQQQAQQQHQAQQPQTAAEVNRQLEQQRKNRKEYLDNIWTRLPESAAQNNRSGTANNDRVSQPPFRHYPFATPRERSLAERIREGSAQQKAPHQTQLQQSGLNVNQGRSSSRPLPGPPPFQSYGESYQWLQSPSASDRLGQDLSIKKNPTNKTYYKSNCASKVKKVRKPMSKTDFLSHILSAHTSGMSCRDISYTVSEDYTKFSTRRRLIALEDEGGIRATSNTHNVFRRKTLANIKPHHDDKKEEHASQPLSQRNRPPQPTLTVPQSSLVRRWAKRSIFTPIDDSQAMLAGQQALQQAQLQQNPHTHS
jgi:hypothetical protein